MSPKRLFLSLLLALFAAFAVVSSAPAGNFDEERMSCVGDNPATCPSGTVGQPYTLRFLLLGDEDLTCPGNQEATFSVSGSAPPGLRVEGSGSSAKLTGTPTQAGRFDFYATVDYPGCGKPASDDRFIIAINPAVAKLTISTEQSALPAATVGSAFSLQMTANLSDAKTWSLAEGTLPPGLSLGASDGVISGTPTTAGTYPFTVRAVIDAQRTDTKALVIVVRAPLVVAPTAAPKPAEVGVPMRLELGATGGSETYVWTLSDGEMPPGVALATNGSVTSKTISGKPTLAGTYRFEVEVADTEGRKTTYAGVLTVAPRLSLAGLRLRPAKVGRPFRAKLKASGGVLSRTWKVKSGVLPRGVRLDRVLGVFTGTPRKAGTYRVTVEVTDALKVKSTKTFTIVVRP